MGGERNETGFNIRVLGATVVTLVLAQGVLYERSLRIDSCVSWNPYRTGTGPGGL
jgi:hypothetical protein